MSESTKPHRWKKGQSGNPKGRPPEGKQHIRDLARQHTEAAINRLAEIALHGEERAAVAACNALLDRGWGKPTQTIDASMTWREASNVELARALPQALKARGIDGPAAQALLTAFESTVLQ